MAYINRREYSGENDAKCSFQGERAALVTDLQLWPPRGQKIESSWFAVILRRAWERMEVGCLIFSPLICMLLRANRVNSRPDARWGATAAGRWTDQGQAGEGEVIQIFWF